jgi:hypothetical protein
LAEIRKAVQCLNGYKLVTLDGSWGSDHVITLITPYEVQTSDSQAADCFKQITILLDLTFSSCTTAFPSPLSHEKFHTNVCSGAHLTVIVIVIYFEFQMIQ